MELIDPRTVYLITALLYLLMPAVVWLALSEQKSRTVLYWCSGGSIFGLGLLLVGTRDIAPDWLSFDIANLFLLAGNLLRVQALQTELKQPLGWMRFGVLLLSLFGVYEAARFLMPDKPWFYLWSISVMATLFYWTSMLGRQLARQEGLGSARWLGYAYLPLVAMLIIRALLVLSGTSSHALLAPDTAAVSMALLGMVSAVLGNTSFLGVFVERVSRQQVQAARERARREEGARLGRQIAQLDRQRGMGLLAASLAHELSQPLTNIHLIAENANLDAPADRYPVFSKYIADVLRNTDNATGIMNRIRGFIRARDVEFRPVNLHDVCTNVTSLMGDWLHSERIDVQIDCGEQPLEVQGDPVQLAQILVNLLRNAGHATAGQADRRIRITLQRDGEHAKVQVQDNGPGFSPRMLQDELTPFQSGKADGLGVGLTISRHIAGQHKGTLTLANAPQGGALVTLQLPAL